MQADKIKHLVYVIYYVNSITDSGRELAGEPELPLYDEDNDQLQHYYSAIDDAPNHKIAFSVTVTPLTGAIYRFVCVCVCDTK
jgi:hypothetical protein